MTPRQLSPSSAARVAGVLCVLGAAALLVLVALRPASASPPPFMHLSPATLKLTGTPGSQFKVDVVVEQVTNLGAFEFTVIFDPSFVNLKGIAVGPFLTSTGRTVTCMATPITATEAQIVCNTPGSSPYGSSGSGAVASLTFSVKGNALGLSHLLLQGCKASDILGNALVLNGCKDSKITINPAPTPTPTPLQGMQKLPPLQNLFLTRQGTKIPPVRCADGTNVAMLTESMAASITSADPKDPAQPQRLGGFSFQVTYDPLKVCLTLRPGAAWTNTGQVCTVQDSATAPTLQGIARINCVTLGKTTVVDTSTAAGRTLALIEVRPQPEAYSQIRANQDNGQVVQLNNDACKLTDLQGHAIAVFSCEDADVTIRFLEGDVEPDCAVNTLDTQAIAFRWGAQKGGLVFNDRFNLEPSGTLADQDVDVNDLQFVYGRFGSNCFVPWPAQAPVQAKG